MAAAQASQTVSEIWEHSRVAEEDKGMLKEESWHEGLRATCPCCNEPLTSNAKFCPGCGAKIQAKEHRTQCGAKLNLRAKFCAECGAKI